MQPLPVMADKSMSFKLLNKRLSLLGGPGKWLRWVKDRSLLGCPVHEVFQRTFGTFAYMHQPLVSQFKVTSNF